MSCKRPKQGPQPVDILVASISLRSNSLFMGYQWKLPFGRSGPLCLFLGSRLCAAGFKRNAACTIVSPTTKEVQTSRVICAVRLERAFRPSRIQVPSSGLLIPNFAIRISTKAAPRDVSME
jgi:hypothetical protein